MAGMRTRWAAIGAAVAVSVGAGGLASAVAQGGPESNFSPQTPERVIDTRDGTGGRINPLGAGETWVFDVDDHSSSVPNWASGVLLNVTAVDGTTPSHMTVFPTGATRPVASNLNWSNADAKANLVSVPLGTAGAISFFNSAGNVNVIADLVGFYTPHLADPPMGAMSRFDVGDFLVASGAALSFDQEGGVVGTDVTYDAASDTFTLGPVGTYRVSYGFAVDISSTAAGTAQVRVDGTTVGAPRNFPTGSGGPSQVSDSQLVTTTTPDAPLTVVIDSGVGLMMAENPSISIERIA